MAGADFLKTSTGKIAVGARSRRPRRCCAVDRRGRRPVGFKAAGGIRTVARCRRAISRLADAIMGPGWATPATFRFGASGLLDDLLAALGRRKPAGGADAGLLMLPQEIIRAQARRQRAGSRARSTASSRA